MHRPAPRTFETALLTRRLLLQCPRPEDAAAVWTALSEPGGQTHLWATPWPWAVQAPPSLAVAEVFCRTSMAEFHRGRALVYLVWARQSLDLVGSVSLHAFDDSAAQCELGFLCRSSQRGRGYMYEANAALLRYALQDLGMQRVEALTDSANLRSRALCERLGMHWVANLQQKKGMEQTMPSTCIYATQDRRERG